MRKISLILIIFGGFSTLASCSKEACPGLGKYKYTKHAQVRSNPSRKKAKPSMIYGYKSTKTKPKY